jgi:transcription-repair coupling factor (superfamily II helicase)
MRKIINEYKGENTGFPDNLLNRIRQTGASINLSGLEGAARAFMAALLFERVDSNIFIICAREKEALAFAGDLAFFLGETDVFYYPPIDLFAVELFSFPREEELMRLALLARLQTNRKTVIVTHTGALSHKIMPLGEFNKNLRGVSLKDTLDRDELTLHLDAMGYKRVSLVEEAGEFSARGNIIDIFPPLEKNPLRVELSGDEIEAIRAFDNMSQRSLNALESFTISPASQIILTSEKKALAVQNIKRRADELSLPRSMRGNLVEALKNSSADIINPVFLSLFYDEINADGKFSQNTLSSIFDYLSPDTLLILDGSFAVQQAFQEAQMNMEQILFKTRGDDKFYLDSEDAYFNEADVLSAMRRFKQISFLDFNLEKETDEENPIVAFETHREIPFLDIIAGDFKEDVLLKQVAQKIRTWLAEGMLIFFACPTPEDISRMNHILSLNDVPVELLKGQNSIMEMVNSKKNTSGLILWEGKLSASFSFPAMKLVFLSEEEIFGKKRKRRRQRPVREAYFLKSFGDLKEGDYVVHTDFGIGIYRGLKKISVGKIENDFLVVEYAEGDKLYIPVNSLERIQRYIGPEGYVPKIDRMGGNSWESVKQRVKKSVREVAEELVSIYAAREVMERDSFSPPDQLYDELCATFEFEETPDQSKAIEDVHLDMDDVKPMDRLICGDAGFGKTEVAIRAAFRVVMDGKQAAVLVPTTILAEQHYRTFAERLHKFPIRVEVLNRFKSPAAQKKILEDLKNQKIDIIVGTHRLLQKDVDFKELGLVVIDEEQRFGVAHKEKLKKMRTLVDVLTLSATPIPRTLHLSLVGIRDLSIINTPPEERLPIKTYVLEFNEEIIKSAIEKELARQGQVFFVHDRVRSIYSIVRLLQKLVPQTRIGIVHGQMKPAEIEKTMALFVRGEIDVLVSTTIISSGLDIATSNTIIINRADRFGLAQLYQLRGRVGRADREAFAYLLLPPGAMLSADAIKRLQAIKEFSQPGSGFRIARNDLEIRGGGNLLGVSQSGHIRAVGYELYTELMEKTMREIKGEKIAEEEPMPEIQLGVSAFIPEEYVRDMYQRLVLYKRISLASNDEEISRIKIELADCYGILPPQTENLLQVISIRNQLKTLHGKKMGYDGKQMYIFFRESTPVEPEKVIRIFHKDNRQLRFTPDGKLFFAMPSLSASQILIQTSLLLKMLAQ